MKCIDEVPASELKGKRVLVRASLDLPVDSKGEVSDVFRLKQALPTLNHLSKAGSKVIILTKIGRDPGETNAPVAKALKQFIPVTYVPALSGHMVDSAIAAMQDGDFILLENLQTNPGEIANDPQFAKEIASLGDMYVNDCFISAHRTSAGMVGVPKLLPSYAGIQFRDEVRELSSALHPASPSLAIIGGAKFETKDPVIRSFLNLYDHVFVVGAIANDVLKAKGFPVGVSKVSEHAPEQEVVSNPRLVMLSDVTVERPDKQARVKKPEEVAADEKIVDIGPDSVQRVAPLIEQASFITWNGPTGLYEEGYIQYTHAIAELISHAVAHGARSVIGGGDTIAAIEESGIDESKLGFLSTGGGAMLEFLLQGTLPGIEALG
ncbi:MAG TPA: phosphoglycerate kinase [Candidatus Paceibacterota bacterium]|jgi:phosphoglycerate kinase|nr:phosphoglycerate kinase [Candidatus Paceibacterota bacterium]